jgi:hypothetical protein
MTRKMSIDPRRRAAAARAHWLAVALALLAPALAPTLAAQPFGPYVAWTGDGATAAANGWLAVPDNPALNPGAAMTLEGWFKLATPFAAPQNGCRSLVGKDSTRGYWLGVCGSTVQASFGGAGSAWSAGTVPAGQWTHIAVTWDGTVQTHYINGEVAGAFPVRGPLAPSPAELRIGSDVSWEWSPQGAAAEVRLWSVARTVDQIRATINLALTAAQPGLVAVWSLGGAGDSPGGYGGYGGAWSGAVAPVALAAAAPCVASTADALCLATHFALTVTWRDSSGATGGGSVVPLAPAAPGAPTVPGAPAVPVAGTGSGIFWFFSPDNWEMMVKVIDGCALNHAVWLFSAATTNVYYRLEVVDVGSGVTKIYFNYPGPPAPAVTDTAAFPASCL